ncbi:epoxide hydrolase [Teratosphaeria destructans]|uniref:Epoxide hydrolase n=1 Tax=Teratosphaeria destructans TaxID=418781 RepID=A0A9W7T073_9PEZI|nr:epoxide hydrolase [Teratosphaeria destructans]
MTIDKITPNDPRITHAYCTINGKKWHYLDSSPPSPTPTKGTLILIHGFPDLSLAWRHQIPFLNALGFRTLALDCMGYGETGPSPSLHDYSFKTHADAIAALAASLGVTEVVVGGHERYVDWASIRYLLRHQIWGHSFGAKENLIALLMSY